MKSTVISPTGQKISGETVQNDYPSEWAEQWQMMTKFSQRISFSLAVVYLFGAFAVSFFCCSCMGERVLVSLSSYYKICA